MKRWRRVAGLLAILVAMTVVACSVVEIRPGSASYPGPTYGPREPIPTLPGYPEPTVKVAVATRGPSPTPWYNLPTPVRERGPTPTAWPVRDVASGPQGTIITLEERSGDWGTRWLTIGSGGELVESVVTSAMADQSHSYWSAHTRLIPSPDGRYVAAVGRCGYHFRMQMVSILDVSTGESWAVNTRFERGVVTAPSDADTWFGGWWPDSRHVLLYDQDIGGIYLVDIMGEEPKAYVSEKRAVGGVAVTPDGQLLAVGACPVSGSDQEIWLMRRDGSHVQRALVSSGFQVLVGWSPDGQQLLTLRSLELALVDRDGVDHRSLGVWQGQPYATSPPVWSPDGGTIAYLEQVHPAQLGFAPDWAVYSTTTLLDVTTGEKRKLVPDDHLVGDFCPVWSPDGEWLAFLSDRSGVLEVWLVRRDGTCMRQLTDTRSWHYGLAWVPAFVDEGF